MKKAFRHDACPLPDFVSVEDAAQAMFGQTSQTGEAEEARVRMLQRMGLKSDDGSAEDHRKQMAKRHER